MFTRGILSRKPIKALHESQHPQGTRSTPQLLQPCKMVLLLLTPLPWPASKSLDKLAVSEQGQELGTDEEANREC